MTFNQDKLKELTELQRQREEEQYRDGAAAFRKNLRSRKEKSDYSRSKGSKAYILEALEGATEAIDVAFQSTLRGAGNHNSLVGSWMRRVQSLPHYNIRSLDEGDELKDDGTIEAWNAEQAAYITLKLALDNAGTPMTLTKFNGKISGRETLTALQHKIGREIDLQMFWNYLWAHFPERQWGTSFVSRLQQEIAGRHASLDQRSYVTKRFMKDRAESDWELAKIFDWTWMTASQLQAVGAKALQAVNGKKVEETEEQIFNVPKLRPGGKKHASLYLELTQTGQDFINAINSMVEELSFDIRPMLCPPLDHTPGKCGGYLKEAHDRKSLSTVSSKIKGDLNISAEHYEFLNALQHVPFRINNQILDVMLKVKELTGTASHIGSFFPMPNKDDYVRPIPDHLVPGSDEHVLERKRKGREERAFRDLQDKAKGARVEDVLRVAQADRHTPQFWLPVFSDFRGRSYAEVGLLSYQGQDHSKALLQFAEGAPVDDRTEHWLKVELSGLMGYDKESWDERLGRVDEYREQIIQSVRDPIHHDFWKGTDKPWQFLAAAQEWVRLFVDNDSYRFTHARVSIDATCSGQQIMAGLLRDQATAEQVNLTKSERPSDVYTALLSNALKRLEGVETPIMYKDKDGTNHAVPRAKLGALADPDTKRRSKARKGGKAIVMVAQYGAGDDTQIKDFQQAVWLPWLPRDLQHEINDSGGQTFSPAEAKALHKAVFKDALGDTLPALVAFVKWTREVCETALNNGSKVIYLPGADGSTVIQDYRVMDPKGSKVRTDHVGQIRKKHVTYLTTKTDEIDTGKHRTSVTANLIHCQDGAVLVKSLKDIGLPFTSTHDSVSGRPGADMDKIEKELRMGLKAVIESDVLRRFVERNGLKWEDHLPPITGDYNPDDLDDALYPYS